MCRDSRNNSNMIVIGFIVTDVSSINNKNISSIVIVVTLLRHFCDYQARLRSCHCYYYVLLIIIISSSSSSGGIV